VRENERRWSLAGLDVTRLALSYQVELSMWSRGRALTLVIEGPFEIVRTTGPPAIVAPGTAATYEPLLSLLHQPVTDFVARADGSCELVFESGTLLRVAPLDRYEAWNTYGEGSLQGAALLCGPGGGRPWGDAAQQ
jgi:uncharacterized protein DUF6188